MNLPWGLTISMAGMLSLLGTTAFGAIVGWLLEKYVFKSARHLNKQIDRLNMDLTSCNEVKKNAESKVFKVQSAVRKGDIFQRSGRRRGHNFTQRRAKSIPILMVANLKGGVGKTTIAANLAAHFDAKGENVLAIDLDYQGSLSSLLLGRDLSPDDSDRTEELLSPNDRNVMNLMLPVREDLSRTHIIPTAYDFDSFENKLMLQYLIDDVKGASPRGPDARYYLANSLYDDDVQKRFDRIIIDAPPRMTIGFVNGLCAATHLLVPTVLDNLSAKAVDNMFRKMRELENGDIISRLELVGVVGTQSTNRTGDKKPERVKLAERDIERIVDRKYGSSDFYLKDAFIPEKGEIAQAAGIDVAYLKFPVVRPLFDALGDIVSKRAPTK